MRPLPAGHWLLLVALLGALTAGCAEDGPLRARVVGYPKPGELGLVEVQLLTVDDLARLDGQVAHLRGGARFVLDQQELSEALVEAQQRGVPLEPDTIRKLAVEDDGEPVSLTWIDAAGVVVPEDFDSLAMLTAYYHMERTWLALRRNEIDTAPLERLATFFEPVFVDETSTLLHLPLLDNAAYFGPARALLLLANQDTEGVPMTLNPGVIIHEYTHAVFEHLVFDFGGLTYGQTQDLRKVNLLLAYNEGTADAVAALLTGDPKFMAHTAPLEVALRRSVSEYRPYSEELLQGVDGPYYDPYPLGSVWASAIWAIEQETGRQGLALSMLLTALDSLQKELGAFDVLTLPELLAQAGTDELGATCRILRERYSQAGWPAGGVCGGSAAGQP